MTSAVDEMDWLRPAPEVRSRSLSVTGLDGVLVEIGECNAGKKADVFTSRLVHT